MMKHLNETVFQSGIHTLWNSVAMHNSDYKHVTLVIEKTKTLEGDSLLTMTWKHAYAAKSSKGSQFFAESFKRRELVPCINCVSSDIFLVKGDGRSLLYSLNSYNSARAVSVEDLYRPSSDANLEVDLHKPEKAYLTSERYVSDY